MNEVPIPPWSLLKGERRYIPAVETDIRKTFARIRREQDAAKPSNVKTLTKRKA